MAAFSVRRAGLKVGATHSNTRFFLAFFTHFQHVFALNFEPI
jgi:hypothetical protein